MPDTRSCNASLRRAIRRASRSARALESQNRPPTASTSTPTTTSASTRPHGNGSAGSRAETNEATPFSMVSPPSESRAASSASSSRSDDTSSLAAPYAVAV